LRAALRLSFGFVSFVLSVAPRAPLSRSEAPAAERFFRRVGMNARWRLAVSVGGFWLCSGRPDHKKIHFYFLLARLGWWSFYR
jgi:hypothetical protein